MSDTEETLKAEPTLADVMQELVKINGRIGSIETKLDNFIEETNIQFEAIRTGTLANNVAFERLTSKVFAMSANLTEM